MPHVNMKFTCKICSQEFDSRVLYKKHQQEHHKVSGTSNAGVVNIAKNQIPMLNLIETRGPRSPPLHSAESETFATVKIRQLCDYFSPI